MCMVRMGGQSVESVITSTRAEHAHWTDQRPPPPTTIHTLARSTLRRAYRSRASVSSAGSGASECRRPWEKRRVKSAGRGADSCGGARVCGCRHVRMGAWVSSRISVGSSVFACPSHLQTPPEPLRQRAHRRPLLLPPPSHHPRCCCCCCCCSFSHRIRRRIPSSAAHGAVPQGGLDQAARPLPLPLPLPEQPLCPCERKDASSCAVSRTQVRPRPMTTS